MNRKEKLIQSSRIDFWLRLKWMWSFVSERQNEKLFIPVKFCMNTSAIIWRNNIGYTVLRAQYLFTVKRNKNLFTYVFSYIFFSSIFISSSSYSVFILTRSVLTLLSWWCRNLRHTHVWCVFICICAMEMNFCDKNITSTMDDCAWYYHVVNMTGRNERERDERNAH